MRERASCRRIYSARHARCVRTHGIINSLKYCDKASRSICSASRGCYLNHSRRNDEAGWMEKASPRLNEATVAAVKRAYLPFFLPWSFLLCFCTLSCMPFGLWRLCTWSCIHALLFSHRPHHRNRNVRMPRYLVRRPEGPNMQLKLLSSFYLPLLG